MTPDDYQRALSDAEAGFFEDIVEDEGLMTYGMEVVDRWIEKKFAEYFDAEMTDELYAFVASLGISMFVQGFGINALRRQYLTKLFDQSPDSDEENDADE